MGAEEFDVVVEVVVVTDFASVTLQKAIEAIWHPNWH